MLNQVNFNQSRIGQGKAAYFIPNKVNNSFRIQPVMKTLVVKPLVSAQKIHHQLLMDVAHSNGHIENVSITFDAAKKSIFQLIQGGDRLNKRHYQALIILAYKNGSNVEARAWHTAMHMSGIQSDQIINKLMSHITVQQGISGVSVVDSQSHAKIIHNYCQEQDWKMVDKLILDVDKSKLSLQQKNEIMLHLFQLNAGQNIQTFLHLIKNIAACKNIQLCHDLMAVLFANVPSKNFVQDVFNSEITIGHFINVLNPIVTYLVSSKNQTHCEAARLCMNKMIAMTLIPTKKTFDVFISNLPDQLSRNYMEAAKKLLHS